MEPRGSFEQTAFDSTTLAADPVAPMHEYQLVSFLGLQSASELRSVEAGGTVICISRPARGIAREYPAFQAWPDIAGEPLLRIIAALSSYERSASADAYGFFTSSDDLLGYLSPIEVLTGRLLRPRAIDSEVMKLLEAPSEQRREAVIEAAEAFAACWFA